MKRKWFVLLLIVVILAMAASAFASGGVWHWHGHGSGGHGSHHCDRACPEGVLDPVRCICIRYTAVGTPIPTTAPGPTRQPTMPPHPTITPPHRVTGTPRSTHRPTITPPPARRPTETQPPGDAPTLTPVVSAPSRTCGESWYERHDPTMSFRREPDYPVVVGQDPDRRGVDLLITGTGGRVIHHYQHLDVVGYNRRCVHSDTPPAGWSGCDLDTDGDGNPDHPGDPHWTVASTPVYECRWHTTEWDNPVVAVDVDLRLTERSREWIEGDLRREYPGAHVQGAYPWPIRWDRSVMGMSVDCRALGVQLPDPGQYRMAVTFTLRDGHILTKVYRFPVYLARDVLVR